MYILGISAFYHDSAACLIKDGEIIAAAQEERFSRRKHDSKFPTNAIKYCLIEANIASSKINNVVFYEKPFMKFERLLETYLAFAPKGFRSFSKAMPLWIKDKLFQKSKLIKELEHVLGSNVNWSERLLFSEHHLSHAASAYYPSPFESAAVLTLDGVGEWTTTSLALGKGNELKILKEIKFPHSIGLLYSAFTYYTGFKVNSGEYKLMGLAPYGEPKFKNIILENLIDVKEDGSFKLNMKYFNYATGLTMTNNKFSELFGEPVRNPKNEKLTQFHMDIAASIQSVTEEIIIKLTKSIAAEFKIKNLCLAGGVALNCVANGKILNNKIFENIWVQPASGDAGGSIGAALSFWFKELGNKRDYYKDEMSGSFLGPSFSNNRIEKDLKNLNANFDKLEDNELLPKLAKELSQNKIIGWFQGRMEFGPRALGARSILANPLSEKMQSELNLKIKFREGFRPFAPSVLSEEVSNWFNLNKESPYMSLVAKVKDSKKTKQDEKDNFSGFDKLNVLRTIIPAVTHVDYSARIQTVHKETNLRYHNLISEFYKITNCPILVNTSFNVRGEPIVCSIEDAYKCFMGTNLDILVCENYILYKEKQIKKTKENYKEKFELD